MMHYKIKKDRLGKCTIWKRGFFRYHQVCGEFPDIDAAEMWIIADTCGCGYVLHVDEEEID